MALLVVSDRCGISYEALSIGEDVNIAEVAPLHVLDEGKDQIRKVCIGILVIAFFTAR